MKSRSSFELHNPSLVSQEPTITIASTNGTNGTNGTNPLHSLSSNLTANPPNNDSKDLTSDLTSFLSTPFSCQADLETVLVKLIKEITHNNQNKSVYVGVLGNQFSRRYGRKITNVVKALKLASSFSLFLESSPLFNLNKTDVQATVSLA